MSWWPLKIEARYWETTWVDRLFGHLFVLALLIAVVAIGLFIVGVHA